MFEQITGMIIVVFDAVFFPLAALQPHISLLIISTILTVLLILINRILVDKKVVKEMKQKTTQVRENLTKAQKEGNAADANKFLAEMMALNNQQMRQTFKPLVISLIVVSLFLPWLKYKYSGIVVVNLPFELPFMGSQLGWLGWYILTSFAIGWVIRKFIEVD